MRVKDTLQSDLFQMLQTDPPWPRDFFLDEIDVIKKRFWRRRVGREGRAGEGMGWDGKEEVVKLQFHFSKNLGGAGSSKLEQKNSTFHHFSYIEGLFIFV